MMILKQILVFKKQLKKINFLIILTLQLQLKLLLNNVKTFYAKVCLSNAKNFATTNHKFTKTLIKYSIKY